MAGFAPASTPARSWVLPETVLTDFDSRFSMFAISCFHAQANAKHHIANRTARKRLRSYLASG